MKADQRLVLQLCRLVMVLMKAQVCLLCASTSPSNEPTTTTAVITTTTTATTTTTTSACATCTLADITLTPSAGAGTVTPTPTGPNIGADGCAQLTVTCTNPGGSVFMQFNVDQGGPLQPVGETVTADLVCVNGQWVYAPAGQPSRVITEVNCVST